MDQDRRLGRSLGTTFLVVFVGQHSHRGDDAVTFLRQHSGPVLASYGGRQVSPLSAIRC